MWNSRPINGRCRSKPPMYVHTYVHQETCMVYYLTCIVITSSTSIQPFIYLGFNLLYAFLYLLVVNQSILFDILNFHLIHMDPESCFSCIIIELRHQFFFLFLFFFHLGQPNKIHYLTKMEYEILFSWAFTIGFHIPFYCIEGKCFCCIVLACVLWACPHARLEINSHEY